MSELNGLQYPESLIKFKVNLLKSLTHLFQQPEKSPRILEPQTRRAFSPIFEEEDSNISHEKKDGKNPTCKRDKYMTKQQAKENGLPR